jgi:hypothetical protein
VPLVQVTDLRFETHRGKQAIAANPEHHLLLQAQLRAAAVELARDPCNPRTRRR